MLFSQKWIKKTLASNVELKDHEWQLRFKTDLASMEDVIVPSGFKIDQFFFPLLALGGARKGLGVETPHMRVEYQSTNSKFKWKRIKKWIRSPSEILIYLQNWSTWGYNFTM
jgi:hypothetical protein